MLTAGEVIAWSYLAVDEDWMFYDDKPNCDGDYDYYQGPINDRALTDADVPFIAGKLSRIDDKCVDMEIRDDLWAYGVKVEGGRYVDSR